MCVCVCVCVCVREREREREELCLHFWCAGRWVESEQLYRESLEKNGEHETAYNNLGWSIINDITMMM